MISEAFASVLKAGRSEFNARFNEARRQFPGLTGDPFIEFLRSHVDAVVAAVSEVDPQKAADTASAAYDAALQLMGQGLIGPAAKSQVIEDGWLNLFPASAKWIAESPADVICSICNALHYLAAIPYTRIPQWMNDMLRVSPVCESAAQFLACGQVASWRAGVAHFRSGALGLMDSLSEAAARTLMEVPKDAPWALVREELHRNPWFNPKSQPLNPTPSNGSMREVLRPGAFRGFGGLFPEPPVVEGFGEHFLVSSGGACWLLTADIFGATFHKTDPAEGTERRLQPDNIAEITVTGTTLQKEGTSLDFPELGSISSVAVNLHSVALTSPLTHSIVLVAVT